MCSPGLGYAELVMYEAHSALACSFLEILSAVFKNASWADFIVGADPTLELN